MVGKDGMLLAFALSLIYLCKETCSVCRHLSACSCVFPNGQGISLSPLANASSLKALESNYTFYFHPCANAPLSDKQASECYKGNGVSLCATHWNSTYSLGTAEETTMTADEDMSKAPQLTIRHGNATSVIDLKCCALCKDQLTVDSADSTTNQYRLSLTSPHACLTSIQAKGLSTGSLLLIYLFVFSGIYFIGGAIALKLLRGATGWEMIPNHTFWRGLPSLVKDGVTFTLNCCRVEDSYQSI